MARKDKEKKHKEALEKEWKILEREEKRLCRKTSKEKNEGWRQNLEAKVPDKLRISLESAFCKAFSIVFEKGAGIIEMSYDREAIRENLQIQNYAFRVKADRKSLKQVRNGARSADLRNMALTTAEGVGLGALGIGLPDIVIFTGVLFKGIYETALRYGFEYDTPKEQYFILKLIETAMQKGTAWSDGNEEVDRLIREENTVNITQEIIKRQIKRTSDTFAADMTALKFVQGLPLIGMIGGTGNPVYYHKVMKYVRLKYRRRYLLSFM